MNVDPSTHQESKGAVRQSADGSFTLYSEQFQQHYHNLAGAVTESRHVFITAAELPKRLAQQSILTIFETGFGSGMNFLLSLQHAQECGARIIYQSVEKYPIPWPMMSQIAESARLSVPEQMQDWYANLKPGWNRLQTSDFELHLFYGDFMEIEKLDVQTASVFYHDAFSPEVNPELWTEDVFRMLLNIAAPSSVLSTFSSASSARARMAAAGWKMARYPGALGKREMTLASNDEKLLQGLKRVNETRLIERLRQGHFN